jgi:hypothetical protein
MIANIQRALGPISPVEIYQALDTANKEVQSTWEWPWLYAEYDVPIRAPYTTGTVSITNGTSSVSGSGTTWITSWNGMRLRVGSDNVDYRVSSITSGTTMTLDQVVNLSSNITNSAYTLYQDSHQMPADFDPGHDMFLGNMTLRFRLKHIPRLHAENQMLSLKQLNTTSQWMYTDDGYDPVSQRYRIRILPPPGGVSNLRFVYRKRCPDLNVLYSGSATLANIMANTVAIPESFDEILELMAQWKLKEQHKLPDAELDRRRAMAKLKALKRQNSATLVENQSLGAGQLQNSSISQWGLMISPTT